MKVIDAIQNTTETLLSFEILPPLKGKGIDSLYGAIDPLMEFSPSFVNVTYHREEYIYKKRKGFFGKSEYSKTAGHSWYLRSHHEQI